MLFPMQYLNITQGDDVGTHRGTYAIDNAGIDSGIDPVFAPVTMKHVARDSARNGNAAFFESTNKVLLADGTTNYITMMFIHDNDISDYKVGQIFAQGAEFGDEGTAGQATGNHCHMEFAKGKFTRMYDQNAYGVYHLPNNMPVEKACYFNDTIIKVGVGDFKYYKGEDGGDKPDQILRPGDKFKVISYCKVDRVDAATNSVLSIDLGGNWIPAEPLVVVDSKGNRKASQVFKVGDYISFDNKVFTVLANDAATNAVQFAIGGKKVWIYASECEEV